MAASFKDPGPVTFRSRITRNGDVGNSSAFVEFPHDLKELFGVGNLVPITAVFDGRVPAVRSISRCWASVGWGPWMHPRRRIRLDRARG